MNKLQLQDLISNFLQELTQYTTQPLDTPLNQDIFQSSFFTPPYKFGHGLSDLSNKILNFLNQINLSTLNLNNVVGLERGQLYFTDFTKTKLLGTMCGLLVGDQFYIEPTTQLFIPQQQQPQTQPCIDLFLNTSLGLEIDMNSSQQQQQQQNTTLTNIRLGRVVNGQPTHIRQDTRGRREYKPIIITEQQNLINNMIDQLQLNPTLNLIQQLSSHTNLTLTDCQKKTVDEVLKHFNSDFRYVSLNCPTGFGKTLITLNIIKQLPQVKYVFVGCVSISNARQWADQSKKLFNSTYLFLGRQSICQNEQCTKKNPISYTKCNHFKAIKFQNNVKPCRYFISNIRLNLDINQPQHKGPYIIVSTTHQLTNPAFYSKWLSLWTGGKDSNYPNSSNTLYVFDESHRLPQFTYTNTKIKYIVQYPNNPMIKDKYISHQPNNNNTKSTQGLYTIKYTDHDNPFTILMQSLSEDKKPLILKNNKDDFFHWQNQNLMAKFNHKLPPIDTDTAVGYQVEFEHESSNGQTLTTVINKSLHLRTLLRLLPYSNHNTQAKYLFLSATPQDNLMFFGVEGQGVSVQGHPPQGVNFPQVYHYNMCAQKKQLDKQSEMIKKLIKLVKDYTSKYSSGVVMVSVNWKAFLQQVRNHLQTQTVECNGDIHLFEDIETTQLFIKAQPLCRDKPVVTWTIQRGRFSESLDFDQIMCVIKVGVPFPNPQQEFIRDLFNFISDNPKPFEQQLVQQTPSFRKLKKFNRVRSYQCDSDGDEDGYDLEQSWDDQLDQCDDSDDCDDGGLFQDSKDKEWMKLQLFTREIINSDLQQLYGRLLRKTFKPHQPLSLENNNNNNNNKCMVLVCSTKWLNQIKPQSNSISSCCCWYSNINKIEIEGDQGFNYKLRQEDTPWN